MLTNPTEGASAPSTSASGHDASSEFVTKAWLEERLKEMKEEISKQVQTDCFELFTFDLFKIVLDTARESANKIVAEENAKSSNAEDSNVEENTEDSNSVEIADDSNPESCSKDKKDDSINDKNGKSNNEEKDNKSNRDDKHDRSSNEIKSTGTCTEETFSTIPYAEDFNESENKVFHIGVVCDNCDCQISGIRYKCRDCKDFDLCEACESVPNIHDYRHIFLKIRHPILVCPAMKRHWKEKMRYMSMKSDESEPENTPSFPHCRLLIKNQAQQTLSQNDMAFKFIGHETVPHDSIFSPGEKFVKKWRVLNMSNCHWNSYTTVRMIRSDDLFQPLHTEVTAPRVGPFQEGTISVTFTAPKFSGYYISQWGFHHMDVPFGDFLWCKIIVENFDLKHVIPTEPPMSVMKKFCEYTQQKHKRKFYKDEKRKKEKRKLKHPFEAWSLVNREPDNATLFPKMYSSSHTATPNNTPFDLTPPKSPEPETKKSNTIATSTKLPINSTTSFKSEPVLHSHKILSCSSSESDSEFVVIPMPKCFDLSEPFKPENSVLITPDAVELPRNIIDSDFLCKSSDNMSQETGVPEVCHSVANICPCSSSSVSIIDSPTCNLTPIEPNIPIVSEPEKPLIDMSETDHVSSGTFPKFPVEGIDSETAFANASLQSDDKDEKTIQVLPEGLVTGALLAAATVYNTARGIISSIQQPGKNMEGLAEGLPTPVVEHPPQKTELSPIQQLVEMGFCNIERNEYLLSKYNNNVVKVVEELINMSDEDWYDSRNNRLSA